MKEVQFIMNLKEVMHGPGPMFASMPVKGRKQTQEKMKEKRKKHQFPPASLKSM